MAKAQAAQMNAQMEAGVAAAELRQEMADKQIGH
jgi:hypothetical protein